EVHHFEPAVRRATERATNIVEYQLLTKTRQPPNGLHRHMQRKPSFVLRSRPMGDPFSTNQGFAPCFLASATLGRVEWKVGLSRPSFAKHPAGVSRHLNRGINITSCRLMQVLRRGSLLAQRRTDRRATATYGAAAVLHQPNQLSPLDPSRCL